MFPQNLLTQWCRLVAAGLARAGVEQVVVSPGSRSTPLVCALAEEPSLNLADVVDERAAAFFALGRSRASGRPTGLVRTSGTAGGHDLPAVMEAKAAGVSLVIVTADRPYELQDAEAPQTADQIHLHGRHAVAFFDLGLPDPDPAALRGVFRRTIQAVHTSRYPVRGAVQVNLRARKPLEPRASSTEAERGLELEVDAVLERPSPEGFLPEVRASAEGLAAAGEWLSRARRPVVACGPLPITRRSVGLAAGTFARSIGAPWVAEAASQARYGPADGEASRVEYYDAALRSRGLAEALSPDLIVHVGRPLTSAAWLRFSARHVHVPRLVLSDVGWPDPDSGPARILWGHPAETLRGLARIPVRTDPEWLPSWRRADRRGAEAVARVFEEIEDPVIEADAARALVGSVPSGGFVVLGNSLPIRHVETFPAVRSAPLDVVCQRGLNGIDGLVAQAVAVAGLLPRPGALVLGDVSLRHDLASLRMLARRKGPFVLMVLHNGGGRIFEMLPVVDAVAPAVMKHFTTPDDEGFGEICRAFGVAHRSVGTRPELARALEESWRRASPTVVEVRVPPDQNRRVSAVLERAMKEGPR